MKVRIECALFWGQFGPNLEFEWMMRVFSVCGPYSAGPKEGPKGLFGAFGVFRRRGKMPSGGKGFRMNSKSRTVFRPFHWTRKKDEFAFGHTIFFGEGSSPERARKSPKDARSAIKKHHLGVFRFVFFAGIVSDAGPVSRVAQRDVGPLPPAEKPMKPIFLGSNP